MQVEGYMQFLSKFFFYSNFFLELNRVVWSMDFLDKR